jgi:hypothetical protein
MYQLSEGAVQFLNTCSTGAGLLLSEKNIVPIYNQLIPAEIELLGLGESV